MDGGHFQVDSNFSWRIIINLGPATHACRFDNPPDWQEILTYFRGSELQNYFSRILEDNLKTLIKPQYVDHIPKAVKGKVGEIVRCVIMAVVVVSCGGVGVYGWMANGRSSPTRPVHAPSEATTTTTTNPLRQKDQRELGERIMDEMELRHIKDREVDQLSGGELQR